jgi:3-deoxy-7-phosphoheptulonate synthase
MLVVMDQSATPEQIEQVVKVIEGRGCEARPIPGGDRVSIGVLNNKGPVDAALFIGLAGVKDAVPITKPYKLVSRETKAEDTLIPVGETIVGNGHLTLIADPCAIESEDQALTIAGHVKKAGAHLFRGGAFKPRTSPYSFQGLGEEGLKILARVRETTGLPVVTEVMDFQTFDLVEHYADVVQIGTRNMQNFSLLNRAGESFRPIMLKRGMAATIEEWLMAAEYIMARGNHQVILCERVCVPLFITAATPLTCPPYRWSKKRATCPSWWIPAMPPADGTRCCRFHGQLWPPMPTASWWRFTISRTRR